MKSERHTARVCARTPAEGAPDARLELSYFARYT